MSEIKIEKDVPIPEHQYGKQGKYPWRNMEPGDSFFAPGVTQHGFHGMTKKYRLMGWTFTSRKENGGVRIWRSK